MNILGRVSEAFRFSKKPGATVDQGLMGGLTNARSTFLPVLTLIAGLAGCAHAPKLPADAVPPGTLVFRIPEEGEKPLPAMPADVKERQKVVAEAAIESMPGKRIVIVIDDTGSMAAERRAVAEWYEAAIAKSGKQIAKVLTFSNGAIWAWEKDDVKLYARGDFENTQKALAAAQKYKPDFIVLITDEPGDDWDHTERLRLPPVIAHSLQRESDAKMKELAQMTHGKFVAWDVSAGL